MSLQKNEFDFGSFTHIEHKIVTGAVKPVKMHMSRTPSCFINEEEEHLKKMCGACFIEPSMTEWAAALS